MMKMNGQDSAECQNWEKKTKWSFLKLFKLEKDKTQIVFVSYLKKRSKNVNWGRKDPVAENGGFSERESSFSLKYQAI